MTVRLKFDLRICVTLYPKIICFFDFRGEFIYKKVVVSRFFTVSIKVLATASRAEVMSLKAKLCRRRSNVLNYIAEYMLKSGNNKFLHGCCNLLAINLYKELRASVTSEMSRLAFFFTEGRDKINRLVGMTECKNHKIL